MMYNKSRFENGQVLILLILTMVGMFGFAALAMDGGRLYADRRFAQNGADAASLAGAGAAAGWLKLSQQSGATGVNGEDWDCSSAEVQLAIDKAVGQAINNAQNNGFLITSGSFNSNGNIVGTRCEDISDQYIDVRVSITLDTQTSFVHFVFQGPTGNTVDAIARVIPRKPVGAGYSIISLIDTCDGNDKGTRFSGTSDVYIDNGGVFSNSCIVSDGSSGNVYIDGDANHDENYPYDPHGDPTLDPLPQPVNYEYKPTIPPPDCVGPLDPAYADSGGIRTYSPGHYTNDIQITGGSVTVNLDPGLYCFDDGADFKVTGSNLYGNGVTLFFTRDGGGFDTQGNGEVQLYAPIEPCSSPPYPAGYKTDCYPAVPNLLIYVEDGNTNPVRLGGNSTSYYEGTVYAPTSQVAVGGTASELTNVGVQIIAESVRVHGTVTMTITYDDSRVFHTPNILTLQK